MGQNMEFRCREGLNRPIFFIFRQFIFIRDIGPDKKEPSREQIMPTNQKQQLIPCKEYPNISNEPRIKIDQGNSDGHRAGVSNGNPDQQRLRHSFLGIF